MKCHACSHPGEQCGRCVNHVCAIHVWYDVVVDTCNRAVGTTTICLSCRHGWVK